MRFKQFLSESPYKPQSVDEDILISWIEKHSPQFLSKGQPIFRGFDPGVELGIIDTNGFSRTSANTFNYYTLWMDNNPAWKDYPKRAKSYICSNDYHTSYEFGEPFVIIPEDSANIGICQDNDLWYSFKYVEKIMDLSMDTLMAVVNGLMFNQNKLIDRSLAPETERNYEVLKKCLKLITRDEVDRWMELTKHNEKEGKLIHKAMGFAGAKNMFECFEDILNPEKNGFKRTTAAAFKSSDFPREVWVQGKCAIIKNSHLDEYPKLQELLSNFDLEGLK